MILDSYKAQRLIMSSSVEKGDSDFIPRGAGGSPKTISLSIDQVNDNADELVDLRGEGRYFGSDQPSGILCSNCHQRGHKRANCKTVVCMACGMLDDHYSQHCPKSIVCSNCGEKGHYKNQCTEKQRRVYCQTCSSTRHFTDRCTSIWRSYLTEANSDRQKGLPTNIYCYNCAEKGHYGDECPLERTSRVPNLDGSAFSGHNLPQQLRDKYFSMHNTSSKKRKRDDDEMSYMSLPSQPKKKDGLFGRIKNTFKGRKNDDYDDYDEEKPTKKKSKKDKKDKKKEKEIRKTQSVPNFQQNNNNNKSRHKSGVLPPMGPASSRSSLDFPRNNNYNQGYGYENYNNNYNSNYNNYQNNYGGGYQQSGYSRSGYIDPAPAPAPTRSGYKPSRNGKKRW